MGNREGKADGLGEYSAIEGLNDGGGDDVDETGIVLAYQTQLSLNRQNLLTHDANGLQHSESLKQPHSALSTFWVL